MLASEPPLLAPAIETIDFRLEFSAEPPWHWRVISGDVVLEDGRASGCGVI